MPLTDLTDDLVLAATAGSRDAAATLAEILQPRVRVMVSARLASQRWLLPELEEITQEAMLALTTSLKTLRMPTSIGVRSYLSRIVTSKVADLQRERGAGVDDPEAFRESVHRLGDNARLLWESISGFGRTPSSAAGRADLYQTLMEEFARLTAVDREILTLAFFDQLGTAEMGEVLKISRGASAMRLQRAVGTLRSRWNGRQDRDPAGGIQA